MKLIICLKQVPDTSTRIQLSQDNNSISEEGIEWIINPYDEFALEEALRIKEKLGGDTELIAVTMGPKRAEKALRTALAMGVNRACLIENETKAPCSLVAEALANFIKKEGGASLILMGKVGIDLNQGATTGMLAEFLKFPQIGFVTKLEQKTEETWLATRQIEVGCKQEITFKLPALVTVEKGINEPRYPSLPGIMRAKKQTIARCTLADLNLKQEADSSIKFHSYRLPDPPPPTELITGSPEEQAQKLAQLLKEQGFTK